MISGKYSHVIFYTCSRCRNSTPANYLLYLKLCSSDVKLLEIPYVARNNSAHIEARLTLRGNSGKAFPNCTTSGYYQNITHFNIIAMKSLPKFGLTRNDDMIAYLNVVCMNCFPKLRSASNG
jgi:hypothetical protein